MAGILRHRIVVYTWLSSACRTVQVTVAQATRSLGDDAAETPRHRRGGEHRYQRHRPGSATPSTSPLAGGAIVAIIVVATILLTASLPLGLVVVLGVPVLMVIVAILIRPLHRRQQEYRDESGRLTTRAAHIVTGLRILRGIGGESTFAARYRAESQRVRAAGVRVARVDSLLEAAQVLPPGIFVALVTWLGARFAVSGEITAGQLVTFCGYAVFLLALLRVLTEVADKITRGHVAARRVVRVLTLDNEVAEPVTAVPTPDPAVSNLVDPESGVVIRPGWLTAISAAEPQDATAIADRLGRYVDSAARLDGVQLTDLSRATVRRLVMVADNDARLFSGRLRDELTGYRPLGDHQIQAACVRPTPRTSSPHCRTGWTARSPSAVASSPAVSSSGLAWPGRCWLTRRC